MSRLEEMEQLVDPQTEAEKWRGRFMRLADLVEVIELEQQVSDTALLAYIAGASKLKLYVAKKAIQDLVNALISVGTIQVHERYELETHETTLTASAAIIKDRKALAELLREVGYGQSEQE